MRELIKNWKSDLPAGIVVFLIALPLCLGIALASGAPLFSGIIAGVIGGVVVGAFSGSNLGVSGPAAGLAVIVLSSINELGAFEVFLLSVVISGAIQILLGFLKAGVIGYYFPNSVIKGMLAGIGILIILKQIPHALGYDRDYEGSFEFFQPDGENTFSELSNLTNYISYGPSLVALISLLILIIWEQPFIKRLSFSRLVQGPLIVVLFGIIWTMAQYGSILEISEEHQVQIPIMNSLSELPRLFTMPDWSAIGRFDVWMVAMTIAIVASLETLLSAEATDKLDPLKRITPTNQELKAQGIGNIVSGLIGGLPVTQVIVRSSANIQSGGRSKLSTIFHGIVLFCCVISIPVWLNKIPLAALAAVLLLVGYKLAKPSYFVEMWKKGISQFIPFVVTILGIVLSDLLVGVSIGVLVSIAFILYSNFKHSFVFDEKRFEEDEIIHIKFAQEMSFFNKASIKSALQGIPDGANLEIDAKDCTFIDEDIKDLVLDFQETAANRNINLTIIRKDNNQFKYGPQQLEKALS